MSGGRLPQKTFSPGCRKSCKSSFKWNRFEFYFFILSHFHHFNSTSLDLAIQEDIDSVIKMILCKNITEPPPPPNLNPCISVRNSFLLTNPFSSSVPLKFVKKGNCNLFVEYHYWDIRQSRACSNKCMQIRRYSIIFPYNPRLILFNSLYWWA